MALSMHEQRMLAEIEQRLVADDPRLASVFSRFSAAQRRLVGFRRESSPTSVAAGTAASRGPMITRPSALRRWTPWAVLAVGATLLGVGVAIGLVMVSLAGSVLVAATPLLIPACTRPQRVKVPDAGASASSRHGFGALRPWWRRTSTPGDRSRELT